DVCMPDLDGFDLCERLRQNPRTAAATIMMLSSAGRRQDAMHCRELGVAAYLTKPLDWKELRAAICSVVNGKRESARSRSAPTPASPGLDEHRFHILLAEDNLVNQQVAVTLLRKRGHVVTVANDGVEALAALEKEKFDVVLMDVQMPRMGGFEATAVIREQERETGAHIPIVAMTAHSMKGDREKCLEAGMDDYVSKPFNIAELMNVLHAVTDPAEMTVAK
ncbi:MAG: response regulator, partial [Acidobacteriaceae bacterium]|nr:response regulator [Acidobacteriaceae bacterium]